MKTISQLAEVVKECVPKERLDDFIEDLTRINGNKSVTETIGGLIDELTPKLADAPDDWPRR